MAQHDYNIANQTGANFRADLNNALNAIATNNSGSSEPATMYAYEWWIDTSANVLKLRNSSNNAWITMPFSITTDNTVDINAGTVNGITSFSFSSGSTVTAILDEDNFSSNSATALATQQSIKAYVDSQVTAQDLDISDGSSTIAIDLDSETLSLLGGTGVTSTASGNGVTFAIGQPVGTSDNVVFNQVTGALVGNASTATALATARTISGVSFDGTANITLDTDDIGEGSSNLYFTDTRANSAIDARVTNTFINNLSGVVADTATALATGRTIGLSGDVTATGVSFDGTGNITLSTTIAPNSIALGTDTVGNYVATIAGSTNEIEVSGSGSETATVTIGLPDNVTISGNLTVNGTTTTVNSDTLAVTDPLIKLAKANSGADSLDIGFYGLYDTSGSQDLYAGLFRDANDSGKFKLFKDLQVEPTTTVNTSGTGYAVGTLVSNLEGTVTGNVTGTVSSISNHSTSDLSEGTNLYYTDARFDTRLAAKTTDNLTEGSSNLYMTTERVQDIVGGMVTGNTETGITVTYDDSDGTLDFVVGTLNQDTTGNAATATALETARAIALSGDVVGTANFDGTAGISISTTIQANSVVLGTDTVGDYVSTITAGTGLTSTGATSGEGVAHSLSVDAAQTQITSVGTLTGLTVNGDVTFTGSSNNIVFDQSDDCLEFADNAKAKFGASDDLQIYHDGSNSRIQEGGTGSLLVRGSNLQLQDSDGFDYLTCTDGGDGGTVVLKHLGSTVLSTASDGIDVTGTVNDMTIAAGGLTCSTSQNFAINSPNGLRINIDSNNDGTAENFVVGHNQTSVDSSNNVLFLVQESGKVAVGSTNPNATFHVGTSNATGDTTNPAIQIGGTSTYRMGMYTSSEGAVIENKNGDDGIQFRVKTAGEAMRIDGGTGRVGIATSSPTAPLHIAGTTGTLQKLVGTSASGDVRIQLDAGGTAGQIQYAGASHASIADTLTLVTQADIRTVHAGSTRFTIDSSGNVNIAGSLSKGSGSFKIDHPLESKQDTHFLVHSFVEAPQADNIYRGKVDLVDGFATVNIDTVAGMTEGTFEALNTDIQCFTTNESDFDAVKGNVTKNILTINCQNTSSTATISWLVIGERKDQHIQNADWTDANGKVIVEVKK